MKDTPHKERVQIVADLIGAGMIAYRESYEQGGTVPEEYMVAFVLLKANAHDFFPILPGGYPYTKEYLGRIIAAALKEWRECTDPSTCIPGDMFLAVANKLIGPEHSA